MDIWPYNSMYGFFEVNPFGFNESYTQEVSASVAYDFRSSKIKCFTVVSVYKTTFSPRY